MIGIRVGRQLRLLREHSGRNQSQLAQEAGLSIRAVRDLESGRSNPNLATVAGIAGVLGVSLDELVAAARSYTPQADWTPAPPEGDAAALTRQLPNPRMRGRIVAFRTPEEVPSGLPQTAVFGHVLSGSVAVMLDGEETALGPGDCFHAQAAALRGWRGEAGGGRLLVVEADEAAGPRILLGKEPE